MESHSLHLAWIISHFKWLIDLKIIFISLDFSGEMYNNDRKLTCVAEVLRYEDFLRKIEIIDLCI